MKPLGLNRIKPKDYWVTENELTSEEADRTFADLKPERHAADGTPEYGEPRVDEAIDRAREEIKREASQSNPVPASLKELVDGVRRCSDITALETDGQSCAGAAVAASSDNTNEHRGDPHSDEPETVGVGYVAKAFGYEKGTVKNMARKPYIDGGFPDDMQAPRRNERAHHRFYKDKVDKYAAMRHSEKRRTCDGEST
jgi:hypothetical protein